MSTTDPKQQDEAQATSSSKNDNEKNVIKNKDNDGNKPTIGEHIAKTYPLRRTKRNKVFVLVDDGLPIEVGSGNFIDHCQGSYLQKYGELPSKKDLSQAISDIKIQSIFGEMPELQEEYGNFACFGLEYYFRTHGDHMQFKVSADGYEPIKNSESPVLFTNTSGTGFVPSAVPDKDLLVILSKYLNMSEQQILLFIGCCIKALAPGPNPVMIFNGPQGAGKTVAAKIFMKIVDPDNTNRRVYLCDNISTITGKSSDDLCKRSHDKTVIVTTINDQMPNQDLVDRTIVFEFEPISETERRPETKILAELEADLPAIMGSIFSGLSSFLANSDIELPEYKSRLADLVQTVAAAAPGLGIDHKDFNKALDSNRIDSVERSLNQNPVSAAAMAFMDAYEGNRYSDTPAKLLETLSDKVDDDITSHSNWPSKPNKLSAMLNRAAPFLKSRGLDVQWGKSGQRSITLVKLAQDIEEQLPLQTSMKDFAESQRGDRGSDFTRNSPESESGTTSVAPPAPSNAVHHEGSAC